VNLETDASQARNALRSAYEMYRLPLLQLCSLLATDPGAVEDIVQDVFIRTGDRLATMSSWEVLPYLRRSAINAWKNELRHRSVERAAAPKLAASQVVTDAASIVERDAMWTEVVRLPPRQRACVVLRFYEDLPDREIAELLGCRVGTVRSQVNRALAKLRKVLPA
jgi:RNA polymerase sigma factor (sigma-70 family)